MRKARALLFLIIIALLFAQSKQAAAPRPLVITHITIINVTGAQVQPDMTVVIAGDRIAEIGKTEELILPQDAKVVDGTGKFLIPGLWDMHVHTLRESRVGLFFPAFIANGVLGVRDMGSPVEELDRIKEWKKETEQGTFLGPRIVAAGPVVDGPQPMFPELSIAVAKEAEGRQAADTLKQCGADFLKVYSLLPRDAYFAIADEAVLRMIAQAIKAAKLAGKPIGICGQAPSDYPEFAAWLVSQGINSISLNLDSAIKTRLVIAAAEAKASEAASAR